MLYYKNLVTCWAFNLSKMEHLIFLNPSPPCWDAFPAFSNGISCPSSSQASTLWSPPFIDSDPWSLKKLQPLDGNYFVFPPPNDFSCISTVFISFQLKTKKTLYPSKDQTTCTSHPIPSHILEDFVFPLSPHLFFAFSVASQQGQAWYSIFKNSFFGFTPPSSYCSTSQLSCSKNCDHNLTLFPYSSDRCVWPSLGLL